jgi:hypothetical protein
MKPGPTCDVKSAYHYIIQLQGSGRWMEGVKDYNYGMTQTFWPCVDQVEATARPPLRRVGRVER